MGCLLDLVKDNYMRKYLLPILLIGLAWGQLKVKSQFDLEPFIVSNVEQGTQIRFENGNMIKENGIRKL